MPRGLKSVLAGYFILVATPLVASLAPPGRIGILVLAVLAILAAEAMIIGGTILISTDKGYSALTGLLFGVTSPLGTVFALLREDRSSAPIFEPDDDTRKAANREAETGFGLIAGLFHSYGPLLSVAFGIVYATVWGADLLRSSGGILVLKLVIVLISGLMAGAAAHGATTILPIAFAPRAWLIGTKPGRVWMQRSGLKNPENTAGVRILAAIIGSAGLAYCVLCVFVLGEALFK